MSEAHSRPTRLCLGGSVSPSTLPGMADVIILHNAACSTSKHALAEAEQIGSATEIVQYLKTPLDRAALLELIGNWRIRPRTWFARIPTLLSSAWAPRTMSHLRR